MTADTTALTSPGPGPQVFQPLLQAARLRPSRGSHDRGSFTALLSFRPLLFCPLPAFSRSSFCSWARRGTAALVGILSHIWQMCQQDAEGCVSSLNVMWGAAVGRAAPEESACWPPPPTSFRLFPASLPFSPLLFLSLSTLYTP